MIPVTILLARYQPISGAIEIWLPENTNVTKAIVSKLNLIRTADILPLETYQSKEIPRHIILIEPTLWSLSVYYLGEGEGQIICYFAYKDYAVASCLEQIERLEIEGSTVKYTTEPGVIMVVVIPILSCFVGYALCLGIFWRDKKKDC